MECIIVTMLYRNCNNGETVEVCQAFSHLLAEMVPSLPNGCLHPHKSNPAVSLPLYLVPSAVKTPR